MSEILVGKRVVVTGGAGLLGRVFCDAIATQGASVVIADLNLQAAQGVARSINERHSGMAVPAELDITSKSSIDHLIDAIHQKHGRIDALVNNAYPRNPRYGRRMEEVEYEDFCENTNLHLGGYFLMMQKFAEYFGRHGGGNIINLASIYGSMAPRFSIYHGTSMTMPVEYAAIKAGVIHLTRYMAQYLKGAGIRVNCLSPGGILDKQPASFLEAYKGHCATKGMLDPNDIAGTLIFLLSDLSCHLDGQNLIVDDGFSI